MEAELDIKFIKDLFEQTLSQRLALTRVSAPIFLQAGTGLNDDLNGTERQVAFDFRCGKKGVVLHSLAKWKRFKLGQYQVAPGRGLYTDMNAIRRDEELSPIHSYYVDQWDWEAVIRDEERTEETVERFATDVYDSIKHTERLFCQRKGIPEVLPEKLHFVTSQQLEDEHPTKTPKERELEVCRTHGAVFLKKIGGKLKSGKTHDGRAPDYDDWQKNGDILVYYPVLDIALELSSMGVRVGKTELEAQLQEAKQLQRKELFFHKELLAGKLPSTVGGGIGQSRLCLLFMRKSHIGEVQASVWSDDIKEAAHKGGIELLE